MRIRSTLLAGLLFLSVQSLFSDLPREIIGNVTPETEKNWSIELLPAEVLAAKPKQIQIVLPEVGFSPENAVLSSGEILSEAGLLTFDVTYDQNGLPSGSYDFPSKGRLVGTGNVILFSGKFELKSGVLSYSGEGIVGPVLIKISLASLDYLTAEEKQAADKELEDAKLLQEKRKRFLQYLKERDKAIWVERLKEGDDPYAQDRWAAEKVEIGAEGTSWEDLEKFAFLSMWHQFDADDEIEQAPAEEANQNWVRVKNAVFVMVPQSGTIDLALGDQHIFKLPQAELVCNYREDPYITSSITLFNQQAELRVTERQLKASIKIDAGNVVELLPQLEGILPNSELPYARFSGVLHISLADGFALEGRIFDVRTNEDFTFDLLPGLPFSFDFLRMVIRPGKECALQIAAKFFGVPAEFFSTIDKQEGFLARIVLRPTPIRAYLPFLPAREFDPLFFSGKLEFSKEKGIWLRGKLQQEKVDIVPLWGMTFDHGAIDFNLSKRQGRIFGEFNIFDLKARGVFNLFFGKDPKISFAAELVDPTIESWEPSSLENFLKGAESQVAPFKFKRLRLIGGVETVDSPVKSLQEALRNEESKKKKYTGLPGDQEGLKNGTQKSEKVPDKDKKQQNSSQKKEKNIGSLDMGIPVLTTTTYVPERDLRFFCAVAGEAVIFNEFCFAAVKAHIDSQGFGLLLVAEPTGEWSLSKGFPKIFEHNANDAKSVQYIKNVVGGAALSNLSFVLSSFKDIETGVERGLNVMGMLSYEGALEENPLFRKFLPENHKLPVYLKKDGHRGIGVTVGLVLNPIDFQNSVLRCGVSTGDVGVFFRGPGMDEIGFKELAGEVLFYPFALMGAAKVTLLYKSGVAVRPMKTALEATFDKIGVGGVLSGVGDVDFAKFLPLFLGKDLAAVLNQTAIFRDWGIELQTTWIALEAMVGAIGTALPTLGIGTVVGIIAFVISFFDTVGIGGGIEIGQGYDPLIAQFLIKGGWDITTLIFEILYEKPGGLFSLFMFLVDLYMYLYAEMFKVVGINVEKPSGREAQEILEKYFAPIDLEKFYIKIVPLGTRMGEITTPFGVGGSLYFSIFGRTVGADLMLDSNGAYALAFVDPIDWGVYKLQPSKTRGEYATRLEENYKKWGLLSFAPEQDHEKKIRLEASASLDKGLGFLVDFDVLFADSVGGSCRAMLDLKRGLDLQGHVEVKIPGLVEWLGLPGGVAQLSVKGWQLNFDNPMAMLYQGDPKNIALELSFTNNVNEAIQKVVRGALDGAVKNIEDTVNAALSNVLQKAQTDEIADLQRKRDAVCNNTGLFGIPKDVPGCTAAEIALNSTKARNVFFDTVDQAGLGAVPELVRQGVTTLSNLGVGALKSGRFVFDTVSSIFELKKLYWRGSVVDVAEGRIPGFIVDAVILGKHITGEIGGIDLTDPLKGVRIMVDDITKLVVSQLVTVLNLPQVSALKETVQNELAKAMA